MERTMKNLTESVIYDHIQYYADVIEQYGEDAVVHDIRVMDDPHYFVQGVLVHATALLYVHYVETGDERAEKVLKQLEGFIQLTCQKDVLKTWGKRSILCALVLLQKKGQLGKIRDEYLDILKEKTDYTDFFNKETLTVIDLPSNYLQVAMSCAAMREFLGWDEERVSQQILNKIMDTMYAYSTDGYLDEQPPYGRYDRYSMLVSSEIADVLRSVQYEVPEEISHNVKAAAKAVLQMANQKGDGINYGRSLSCHGDGAALEILSTALALHLLDETEKEIALKYSVCITQKLFDFWYDKEIKGFNIWWKGRNTNAYRGKARFLEVNLDMPVHMLTTLHNFEEADLAEAPEPDVLLPAPEQWKMHKIVFNRESAAKAECFILRRKDTLAMLPLIGIGTMSGYSAYQPYPAICGVLEAPPESRYPFLIPEYTTSDGRVYRPIQFYSDIQAEEVDGMVKITVKGNLTEFLSGNALQKADIPFVTEYTFDDDNIQVVFETDLLQTETRMFVGVHDQNCSILTDGFDVCETVPYNSADFDTPHGAITDGRMYYGKGTGKVSYMVKLP